MPRSTRQGILSLLLGVLTFLVLLPAGARAEDLLARRLHAVLDRAEANLASGGGAETELGALRPLLQDLEERHARRERAFEQVARHRLPPKAMERLRRAREAHRVAMVPLIEMLQGLVSSPSAADSGHVQPTAAAHRDRLSEAREVLRRMEAASRREPISAGELSVRAPSLTPPPLGQTTGVTTSSPIGHVPQILKDLASGLGGPAAVYEWVRNSIAPEFYYGAMKGPVETYLEGSGNDADTAALLVQLLRAKGVPARYARGTVEVPIETLTAFCGTANADQAVRVLARGGVPHEVVMGVGGIASVKIERIWAEAYLPYANYRGALLDAQGAAWIPLDPGFKRLVTPNTYDVSESLGFDAPATWREYLSASRESTPLEFVRGRIGELLAERQPTETYEGTLNQRDFYSETLGILPNSLPYEVLAQTEVSYDIPEPLTHTVRFVAERDGETLLDATLPVADLLGQRLTLAYLPFSDEDEAVVASFGSLTQTPPYLIDVKPILRLSGVAVAAGTAPVGMGVRFTFRMEFKTPGSTETIENTLVAGNLTAIGLSGRQVTASEARADLAASILADLGWSYFERWNASDDELARIFKVVPVRPTVSACLVASAIDVEYAGGDPLYPLTFDWKGILIDADRRSSAPVGIASREAEQAFLLMSGLEGSVLEHRVFEDRHGIAAVSTAKALGLSAEQGIAIHDVTAANAEEILPGLPFSEAVIDDVRAAVDRGWLVRIPAASLTYLAWTGVGYVLLDQATGEAAYQLDGAYSGGMTAPAVINIPAHISEPLIKQREESEDRSSADVAFIVKSPASDYQRGTVNKTLETPLKVYVTDAEGFAVKGALVVFRLVGGGGALVHPETGEEGWAIEVFSDENGAATAGYRLGKRTGEIPRYTCEEGYSCDGETSFDTQVGLNMVTAEAGTAVLETPFYAFGFPDEQFDGKHVHGYFSVKTFRGGGFGMNLTVAGLLVFGFDDEYGNPISNVELNLNYLPPPELADPANAWNPWDGAVPQGSRCRNQVPNNPDTPGGVLTAKEYEACAEKSLPVRRHDCPGSPSAIVPTSVLGSAFYPVLGDSPYSIYKFDSEDAEKQKLVELSFPTAGALCASANPNDCNCGEPAVSASAFSRSVVRNGNGDAIEAYPPGSEAKMGFGSDALYEKERIVSVLDDQNRPHYFAYGTNQWVREPLNDSQFGVDPKTPETTGGPIESVGDGRYEGPMQLSPLPQLNTVGVGYKLFPPDVPYLAGAPSVSPPPGVWREVNPAYVSGTTLTGRVKDRSNPWQGSSDFSLWGVRPEIKKVTPAPLLLTWQSTVERGADVSYSILPKEYPALLDARDVRLDVKRGNQIVLSAYGADGQPFSIPGGLKLEPGSYDAVLNILGVSVEPPDIQSAPFRVLAKIAPILLVDTNRDGVVDDQDEQGKAECTKDRGAIFTVNLDRDEWRVDSNGRPIPDAVDFGDDGNPVAESLQITNEEDARDLAPMVLRGLKAPLPPEFRLILKLDGDDDEEDIQAVHIFVRSVKTAGWKHIWGQLGDRRGKENEVPTELDITKYVTDEWVDENLDMTFGIEGMFFRNGKDYKAKNYFDGRLDFDVELRKEGSLLAADSACLVVAPWLMLPNTQPSEEVWAAKVLVRNSLRLENQDFLRGLDPSGQLCPPEETSGSLRCIWEEGGGGRWLQDHVETGYYQRPGGPKTFATFRWPYFRTDDSDQALPQPVWPHKELLRPGYATFQYGTPFGNDAGRPGPGSGNYGGNIELLPPTPKYPLGRIVAGDTVSTDLFTFFGSQEAQPPAKVPTQWLSVGHFDEAFAFLPTDGTVLPARGQVAVADPALAYTLMEEIPKEKRGEAVLFAIGSNPPKVGVVTAPTTEDAPARLNINLDLSPAEESVWQYVRIYSGAGAGQVGRITKRGNGFLEVGRVWNVGSKVVPSSDDYKSIYYDSFLTSDGPTWQNEWNSERRPQQGDLFVLVEDTQKWEPYRWIVSEDGRRRRVPAEETPAFITVEELLNDTDLKDLNAEDIAEQITHGRDALDEAAGYGLAYVSVPVIYVGARTGFSVKFLPDLSFAERRSAVAFTPGLANLQVASGSLLFPHQFGPRVSDGDLFETTTQSTMWEEAGMQARFLDDWNTYHRQDGEVHCATTVVRTPFAFDWWTHQPDEP